MMSRHNFIVPIAALLLCLSGCSDDNDSNDGPTPAPAAPPANTTDVSAELKASEVIGGGTDAASGTANFIINLDDDTISGTVSVSGVTADAVSLNQGFAGEAGAELLSLQQDDASTWSVPENSPFTDADVESLNAGNIYVQVSSSDQPNGALRGQFVDGDIAVLFVTVSGAQEVPPVTSAGMAEAAITLNSASGALTAHVNTVGLDDAVAAHIHQALAGVNGDVLIGLTQDPDNVAHWFSEDATLDAAGMQALNAGELYVNVHTPANAPGEVRGQIVPDGIEVVFTTLSGANVVDPSGGAGVTTSASAVAATTIQTAARIATLKLNTLELDMASDATINQAPVGQNGPVVFTLAQDADAAGHWSLADISLSEGQYTALRNQGLYVTVASPTFPTGEVRGQLEPAMSSDPNSDAFIVASVSPADGAEVEALPAVITVTFNRAVLEDTVGADQVTLMASGGDGTFGDGNEVNIIPSAVSVSDTMATIDLAGVAGGEDVYQLALDGSSTSAITDTTGIVLDGDADGNAGGDFNSTMTVATAAAPITTFSSIQDNVFTPTCAVSGCHAGASPAAGMNLSAGQAFANIVGVASGEVPALQRVNPGDADNSYLVQKVEGTAAVGMRMPLGGAPLSNELIQNIREWIDAAAENN